MTISLNKHVKERVIHGRVDQVNGKVDQRRSSDKWTYLLKGLAIVGWGCFFLACITNYQTQYVQTETNLTLLFSNNLYVLIWISAFSSYLSLVLAKYRSRRASDSKNFNMMMLLVVAFAWSSYLLTAI